MELSLLTGKVCDLASKVGDFIIGEAENFKISAAELKGTHDFVSYVDIEAEKKIINKLSSLVPEAGFIAEEGTTKQDNTDLKWIIDPLDGTTNFIHGLPVYSISIALSDNNKFILGVVFNIPSGEMFYAYENGGAWLNDERIHVSQTASLNDCLVATGFPFKDYGRLENYMSCLKFFIANTHGVRRMGSAAVDLAYVACGRFDAFYEYGLNKWDIAAGTVIIEQAGGRVSDFSGNAVSDGSEIVASNKSLFEGFRTEVERYMNKKVL